MTSLEAPASSPRSPKPATPKAAKQQYAKAIREYKAKKTVIMKQAHYHELLDALTDEWDASTILADWASDFPGTPTPMKKWADIIATLCAIHNTDEEGRMATSNALQSRKHEQAFPFGIEVPTLQAKTNPEHHTATRSDTNNENCHRCGLDTTKYKHCPSDGQPHQNIALVQHREVETDDQSIRTFKTTLDTKMAKELRKMGSNLEQHAEALEAAGFDELSKLEGVTPENLIAWISPHAEGTFLPGDAMTIINTIRKEAKKKKEPEKEDSEFDVSMYPEMLKQNGPEVLINTLHRKLLIHNNDLEKKKLFELLENWIRMAWRQRIFLEETESNKDMWTLVQGILNQIRAIDLNRQGKPGTALLAQLHAKKKTDDLGQAAAAWDLRTKKTDPRIRNQDNYHKGQKTITCFNCGKAGHMARECRSKKAEKKDTGRPPPFPSTGASGRAGL